MRVILQLFLTTLFVIPLYGQPNNSIKKNPSTKIENNLAATLKVRHISVADGLSQGSNYTMLKDSRGFMWFTSYEGLNRYDGREIVVFRSTEGVCSMKGSNTCGVVEDGWGNIWFGTEEGLNVWWYKKNCFEFFPFIDSLGHTNKTLTYPFYADSLSVYYMNDKEGLVQFDFQSNTKNILADTWKYSQTNHRINSVVRSSNGDIWIREREGLIQFNPKNKTTSYYFSSHPSNKMGTPQSLYCFVEQNNGIFWIGAERKIIQFNPQQKAYQEIDLPKWLSYSNIIGDIKVFQDSLLWLGSSFDGSLIFNPKSFEITPFTLQDGLTNLSNANVYIDDENIVWINVDPDGINQINEDVSPFRKYTLDQFDEDFPSFTIRSFFEMPNNKIWVGTEMEGLFLFDPETDKIEKILNRKTHKKGLPEQGRAFWLEDHLLWIGSSDGIYQYDLEQQKILPKIAIGDNVDANFIWDFQEVPNGTLWIATDAGVFFKTKESKKIQFFDPLGSIRSGKMYFAQDRLFIPEHFNGVYVINPHDGVTPISQTPLLPEINVKCMYYQEKNDWWWIATNTGLLKVQFAKDFSDAKILDKYEVKDGLPSNYLYSVLPGESDHLWLSTNKGIVKYIPSSNQFITYNAKEDVQGLEYNTNAFLKTSREEIYMGGVNGFNRFFPANIQESTVCPVPIFTSLQVNDQPYKEAGYIGAIKELRLEHDKNTIEITFVTPDFFNEGQNEYQYQLKNFDKEWIHSGQRNFARYTQLPPGEYHFQVKAANGTGKWNPTPRQISIHILSPWWRTYWAYLLYVLGIGFLGYQFFQYWLKRRELHFTLQLEQAEAQRLKELDTLKNRFFTNITHEFRTPLTVIKGLANQIRQRPNHQLQERLEIIDRNTYNIQLLIDQLLDLSKLETGNISIHYEQGHIVKFLRYITESFHSLAFERKINLTFYAEEDQLIMDYDTEKLKQIVTNLLMNALKFTPEYGKILVVVETVGPNNIPITEINKNDLWINKFVPNQAYLKIKVTDSGGGIAPADLPHIFDRFFRSEITSSDIEGSGLGLALVKELATLLEGVIEVHSQPNQGSAFMVFLPIIKKTAAASSNHLVKEKTSSIEKTSDFSGIEDPTKIDKEQPVLLIVEDNADVIYYIKSCVSDAYQIIEARNGKEGLDRAIQEIPDIIISDVMMPEMDGYELGAALQQNLSTSHIPFLLLTAKASLASKRKGLQAGALAYIIKPFDKEELLIRLQKLIQWKQQLQTYVRQQSNIPSIEKKDTPPIYAKELAFLDQLNQQILLHIEEEDFKALQLAKKMTMSESQLYRKLKATTNQSIAKYIQTFRLQQAHEMLLTKELQVGEVARKVGFKQFSHFSKAFQKHFGIRPSDLTK